MKAMIVLGMLMTLVLSGCVFQHGTTRDIVQGWDKGILWYHMYLKNDHSTAYCFDDPSFVQIFDEAQRTQREIIVTYETYLIRGSLCEAGSFERVIVTDVRWAE